ncbi:MAG: small basic family protein [Fimbriimonadaceae bacterium]|nr:small basic family protein [Fimbriimonadaceae bacterium]
MMILIPIVALLLGAILAQYIGLGAVTGMSGNYLAVACVAGLDSVTGGIRAGIEGKFSNDVFITGFISNVVISFILAWLGDQIGANLTLAAVIILGTRIFTNLSLIRRYLLTTWRDNRERAKMKEQIQQQKST